MTKLIVNADDFGYSKGVNLGIIEAHREGIVSSATLMTTMSGADHAMELAKENKELGVGIHLVLDLGYPVHPNVPSLVNEHGRFNKMDHLYEAEPDDIQKELTSQLEKFLSNGRTPTHIDSHHHVHGHENVFPIVKALAEKYQLPMRKVDPAFDINPVKTVEYFNDHFYGDELDVHRLIEILQDVQKHETAEIMVHPAYIDQEVLDGSSYNLQRVKELDILTRREVRSFLEENNILLTTYNKI